MRRSKIQWQQNKKRTGFVIFVLRFDEKEKRKILKLMRGLRTTTTSDNKTQTTTIDFVSLLLNSNNDNIVNITLDDRCAFCQIMLFTLRLRVGEMGLNANNFMSFCYIFSTLQFVFIALHFSCSLSVSCRCSWLLCWCFFRTQLNMSNSHVVSAFI